MVIVAPITIGGEQAVLSAVPRPLIVARIARPVARPLWRNRPASFPVGREVRMIGPDSRRFMAQGNGATVRSGPVDHRAGVTGAHLVVELIVEAGHDA